MLSVYSPQHGDTLCHLTSGNEAISLLFSLFKRQRLRGLEKLGCPLGFSLKGSSVPQGLPDLNGREP